MFAVDHGFLSADNLILYQIPKASVDIAIKSWPHVLGCSTAKMNSMVEQFAELGVNKTSMVPVITSSPQLLLRKPKEFLEVYYRIASLYEI